MKIVYILIAVLLLIAGYFILTSDDRAMVNESMSESETIVTPEEAEAQAAINANTSNEAEAQGEANTNTTEETEEVIEVTTSTDTEVVATAEKTFTLDSFNFGYSMEEIRVKKGDTVTINLTNSDGFHDWVVDEFDAATAKIQAGNTTSVTFVADTVGTFEYYCSVGSHRAQGMVGNLIVE